MSEQQIFICAPSCAERKIEIMDCPTCKSEQPMFAEFYEWYGWTVTCLNCGEEWQDGERSERPFCRGWRKLSIGSAKERAAKAGLKFIGITEV